MSLWQEEDRKTAYSLCNQKWEPHCGGAALALCSHYVSRYAGPIGAFRLNLPTSFGSAPLFGFDGSLPLPFYIYLLFLDGIQGPRNPQTAKGAGVHTPQL